MNHYKSMSQTNVSIGSLFFNQGNYARAIEYYFKALAANEKQLEPLRVAIYD